MNKHKLPNKEIPAGAVYIVTGMARGADMLAHEFALSFNVKRYEFPADWNQYGKRAGFIRNKQMIEYMKSLGKPTYIVRY